MIQWIKNLIRKPKPVITLCYVKGNETFTFKFRADQLFELRLVVFMVAMETDFRLSMEDCNTITRHAIRASEVTNAKHGGLRAKLNKHGG